jgi:Ca-activated chloride channel family protein
VNSTFGQSGKVRTYSENTLTDENGKTVDNKTSEEESQTDDDDLIRIDTNLVIIPTQISDQKGKSISGIDKTEFKIFENNIEQEIEYFSNTEQPFTVALLLDMSYSSVFKLEEIRNAALKFVNQLRENDKVMVISFDENVRVLCKPTNDRKILRLAIEGTRIASGTSLYDALNTSLEKEFEASGRKAIVLLSDGVDTTSRKVSAEEVLRKIGKTEVIVYPIRYDTFSDVQKSRRESAMVVFDENDRQVIVQTPKIKGEREEDYKMADYFLKEISNSSGGRIYRVSSTTNLNAAFSNIADELRKTYSLGYYPIGKRENGKKYQIKVRVYRPNLIVRAKNSYTLNKNE